MNEGDRNRSFSDRGRDALDVAAADVADCEHPRAIRFQQKRLSRQQSLQTDELKVSSTVWQLTAAYRSRL